MRYATLFGKKISICYLYYLIIRTRIDRCIHNGQIRLHWDLENTIITANFSPLNAFFTGKKHLYFYRIRQNYGYGKKNAFYGKCWTFQESKKERKDYEEQQSDQCPPGPRGYGRVALRCQWQMKQSKSVCRILCATQLLASKASTAKCKRTRFFLT